MSTVNFLAKNTTDQGNWIGKRGADGYRINGVANSDPAYVGLTFSGDASYTFADPSVRAQGMQKPRAEKQ